MKNSSGFVAFTSLLIVSAITLAIAVSVSLLGVNESRNSLDYKRGTETLMIADSCVEEAMYRLKSNTLYTGSSLNVGDGQCTINVSPSVGEDRTIVVSAQISSASVYVKKIQADVKTRGGGLVLRQYKLIP